MSAERRRHLDREHLQPQRLVELQRARDPAALAEEQRRLLAADRHHGHDRGVELERELDEAGAPREVDLVLLPARPVGLVVAARVDEQRGAAVQRGAHVVRVGGHRAEAAQARAHAGHLEDEVVGELVEAPLGAEVVVEVLGEDERVGDQRAAGVVADEQHRLVGRDLARGRGPRRGSRRRSRRGSRAAPRGCSRGRGRRASRRARRPFDEAEHVQRAGDVARHHLRHRVRAADQSRSEHGLAVPARRSEQTRGPTTGSGTGAEVRASLWSGLLSSRP